MSIYTIILDISILVVLCLTIVFCLRLNTRIIALQQNKAELEGFIKSLDTAIIKSHNSIVTLKEITAKADFTRQKYVKEANELADDLSMMISSGNRLMQRSDEAIKTIEDLLIKIDEVNNIEKLSVNKNKIKNKIN
jgi:hypothetical protein